MPAHLSATKKAALYLGAAAALVLTSNAALAGGFALREQSTYYQGTSFAGAAAGGTLSSMFWNPAALGNVGPGITNEAIFNFIVPTSDVSVAGIGSQGDIGLDAFVPGSYGAYRLNERIALGFSVNGPFGLATKLPITSPLRAAGVAGTSEVFSLNATPTIAFNANEWLTLAVGLQVQYITVRYTAAALPAPLGISSLDVDDIGLGFTAGVLLTPFEGTSIGLGYRSRIDHDLEGTLLTGLGPFSAAAPLTTPDTVTFGIEQRITDTFTAMAGVEWANWSNVDIVTVTGAPAPVPIPFNYEDGWYFSLGGEYQATESLALRAGIAYEISPITDAHRTYRLPDNDRWWFSAGASYTPLENIRIDLGYSYILPDSTPINRGTLFGGTGPNLNGPFQGTADADVHIFTVGVNVALEEGLHGLFGGH